MKSMTEKIREEKESKNLGGVTTNSRSRRRKQEKKKKRERGNKISEIRLNYPE